MKSFREMVENSDNISNLLLEASPLFDVETKKPEEDIEEKQNLDKIKSLREKLSSKISSGNLTENDIYEVEKDSSIDEDVKNNIITSAIADFALTKSKNVFNAITSPDVKKLMSYAKKSVDDIKKAFSNKFSGAGLNVNKISKELEKEKESQEEGDSQIDDSSGILMYKRRYPEFYNWLSKENLLKTSNEDLYNLFLRWDKKYNRAGEQIDTTGFVNRYSGNDRLHSGFSLNMNEVVGPIKEEFGKGVISRYISAFRLEGLTKKGGFLRGPNPLNFSKRLTISSLGVQSDGSSSNPSSEDDIENIIIQVKDDISNIKVDDHIMVNNPETIEDRAVKIMKQIYTKIGSNKTDKDILSEIQEMKTDRSKINTYVADNSNLPEEDQLIISNLMRDDNFGFISAVGIPDVMWTIGRANRATHIKPGLGGKSELTNSIINTYNTIYSLLYETPYNGTDEEESKSKFESALMSLQTLYDMMIEIYSYKDIRTLPEILVYFLRDKVEKVRRDSVRLTNLRGLEQHGDQHEMIEVIKPENWPKINDENGLPLNKALILMGSKQFIKDANQYVKDVFSSNLSQKRTKELLDVDRRQISDTVVRLLSLGDSDSLNDLLKQKEVAKYMEVSKKRYEYLMDYLAEDIYKYDMEDIGVFEKDSMPEREWLKQLSLVNDENSSNTLSKDGTKIYYKISLTNVNDKNTQNISQILSGTKSGYRQVSNKDNDWDKAYDLLSRGIKGVSASASGKTINISYDVDDEEAKKLIVDVEKKSVSPYSSGYEVKFGEYIKNLVYLHAPYYYTKSYIDNEYYKKFGYHTPGGPLELVGLSETDIFNKILNSYISIVEDKGVSPEMPEVRSQIQEGIGEKMGEYISQIESRKAPSTLTTSATS